MRRDFPRLAGMLARDRRRRGSQRHDQRLPARARCRGARRRRRQPLQRVDRLAPARPLLRADPARRARPACCAASRRSPRFPEAHPIKINAVGDARLHRGGGAAARASSRATHPYEVRFIEFMPLDADHAWTPDQVLPGDEIRAAIHAVYPLEPRAARAERDRARLPLRRRPGQDRLHQPGLRPVLRRLQPDPGHLRGQAPDVPVLAARDRPARRRCATGADDAELEQIIRDAVWRKELKHRVNDPGFRQPARSMSRIGG